MIPHLPYDDEEENKLEGFSTWIWLLMILGVFGLVGVALIYGLEMVLSYLVVV